MSITGLPDTDRLRITSADSQLPRFEIPGMADILQQRADLNRAVIAGDIDPEQYSSMVTGLNEQASALRQQYGHVPNTRLTSQLQPS